MILAAHRAPVRRLAAAVLGVLALSTPPLLRAPGATAADCPPAGGVGSPDAPLPSTGQVAILGHGYGHNVGMSQYGAQGAASLGCDSATILRTYYPGLTPAMTQLPSDQVLVQLLTNGGAAGYTSVLAEGGPITWTTGTVSVVQPVGTTWSVRVDGLGGQVVVDPVGVAVPGLAATAGVELRASHDGAVVRATTYRTAANGTASRVVDRRNAHGYLRFTATAAGLTARWVLLVPDYLRGIAEMPSTWLAPAQEAQIVAARSYLAGHYSASEGGFSLLPTPADQNWTGASKEADDARYGGKLAAAVAATTSGTSGVVMVDSAGAIAKSLLYTSSHGGWSERSDYSFSAPVTHLQQVDDSRWDAASGNPYRAWSVGVTYAQLARAFAFDTVSEISVPPRGNPLRTSVSVTGLRAGIPTTQLYQGMDARNRLQSVAGPAVRSPGFTFRAITFGGPGAVPISGDWDGNGTEDLGWFRNGYIALLGPAGVITRYRYGTTGDVPVVGDWNGDGVDTVAVFRRGRWYLRDAPGGGATDRIVRFGEAGDRPLAGHWAAGPVDSIAVVRRNVWYWHYGTPGPHVDLKYAWGRATDVPLVGDWDANGTDTPAIFRSGVWYFTAAVTPVHVTTRYAFAKASDRPFPGDWDGDGSTTPGAVRDITFYQRNLLTAGPTLHQEFTG